MVVKKGFLINASLSIKKVLVSPYTVFDNSPSFRFGSYLSSSWRFGFDFWKARAESLI